MIDEVATRFAASFEADPQLLYTLAQALAAEGKAEKANEAADRALHLNPDRADEHRILAFVLQHRGLVDWSDREFRHVIDMKGAPLDVQGISLKARFGLAESLHDRSLDREAGEVMQGLSNCWKETRNWPTMLPSLHCAGQRAIPRPDALLSGLRQPPEAGFCQRA